ncbi:prohibitin-3, mitochondrial-like [Dorcoceras hygrometricum]|uniref:Prohibitin-3, mitochondrial-like n=1 Tax=Dorcoceras hygrometricum TaxID=472368 RepID=A0A2Z7CDJ3_9LAMI|nr:prohibitin-3, mitochondrial-like [Dorcoceras hygrometricum]
MSTLVNSTVARVLFPVACSCWFQLLYYEPASGCPAFGFENQPMVLGDQLVADLMTCFRPDFSGSLRSNCYSILSWWICVRVSAGCSAGVDVNAGKLSCSSTRKRRRFVVTTGSPAASDFRRYCLLLREALRCFVLATGYPAAGIVSRDQLLVLANAGLGIVGVDWFCRRSASLRNEKYRFLVKSTLVKVIVARAGEFGISIDDVSVTQGELLVLVLKFEVAAGRRCERDVFLTAGGICVAMVAADQQARLCKSVKKRRRLI